MDNKIEIQKLQEAEQRILRLAREAKREMTSEEADLFDEISAHVEHLHKLQPEKALTVGFGSGPRAIGSGTGGFDSMGDFMQALFRKSRGEGYDTRLEPLQVRASIGETVGSEGGFAIPTILWKGRSMKICRTQSFCRPVIGKL